MGAWVAQLILGAQLVLILGTLVTVFIAMLLAPGRIFSGRHGDLPDAQGARETPGGGPSTVKANQHGDR